jgi:methylglutaconyl-CoA hydratase
MDEMNGPSTAAGFAVQSDAGVLEIALNRPERRNPLDYGTIAALYAALRDAEPDPAVRCVLLRGEGPGFTAGGDLLEFSREAQDSAHDLQVSGNALAELLAYIPRFRKPIVTAAHGFAMAGGLGILAASDVALCATTTKFALSEVKIGLFPLMVLPPVRDAIGIRRARELALTGRRFGSEEALRIGLVHEVLPDEGFLEAARNRARDLAALGSITVEMGKAYLLDIDGVPRESAMQLGRAVRGAFMTSPDFKEGVSAFLEKRTPDFT